MKKYAIVGFGCAGFSAAKALRECCPGDVIDVFSNTPDAPANPMLTTYYVAGKIPREQVFPFGEKETLIKSLALNLFESREVKRLDAPGRRLMLDTGEWRQYDDIILATGSHPLIPPINGMPEHDVYVMRTVYDADRLLERIRSGLGSALVIGASWVGIKVVEALFAYGIPTVLADMAPRIFPTATIPEAAEKIHCRLEEKGIRLLFGRGIVSLREEKDGITAVFSDGTEIKSELVALCLGMRPTLDYLNREEIGIGRGIRVDEHQCTSVPHIYAAGDCCETEEIVSGQPMVVNLWANSSVQGRVAARNIAGFDDRFQGNFIHNITHFLDMDFIGAGDCRSQGETVIYESPEGWSFYMISRDGTPKCINILDNTRLSGPVKAAMLKRIGAPDSILGMDEVMALKEAGLPESLITQIGGNRYDYA